MGAPARSRNRGSVAGAPSPSAPATSPIRQQLLAALEEADRQRRDLLRRLIVEQGRFDILATEIFGLLMAPHHLRMLQHQARYPDANMQLAFRGAGKSTLSTIVYAIGLLCQDHDLRILVASRSGENASDMLKEMKGLIELPAFVEVFGNWVSNQWDDGGFNIAPKKRVTKEHSVTAVGIEGAVVSKHYDVILCDDLVDEKNAATPTVRSKTHTFFYKTLMPTLEPNGLLSVRGTRYHPDDLYGHLLKSEMAGGRTLIIPALIGNAADGWRSQWPEKWPVEKLLKLRTRMGTILFDTQYQCDAEGMRGEIFDLDDCQLIDASEVPADLPRFIGVDLAISEKQRAHYFAMVEFAWDSKRDYYYFTNAFEGRLKFHLQRDKIIRWCCGGDGADPETAEVEVERCAIEVNAYQDGQFQEVKRKRPDLPIVRIQTETDKRVRAWKLQPKFQDKRMFFVRNPHVMRLIEVLVKMPAEPDDLFDAMDHGVRGTRVRNRVPREEPGLI
ncbi:hypothetical protein [Zavarzinia sp.]|jgi:phage terminase large subunit-like protein|uniref:hypothetical protein n=1 Tax=Zavarzinia sp. TaxID=2027920 RepID=UPI003565666E